MADDRNPIVAIAAVCGGVMVCMVAISLIIGCHEDKPSKESSSAKSVATDIDVTPPEPTTFPVEAWVVTAKQTYRPGEIVDLKLRVKNRTDHTVRLPVPVVCVNGSGWGELRLDLFINGRKSSAECHTADLVKIDSGDEVSWPIRVRSRISEAPWDTEGDVKVYSVWQRVDHSAQTENDFLGPLVSHAAEFDILASKPK